jgi:hypothetical protein
MLKIKQYVEIYHLGIKHILLLKFLKSCAESKEYLKNKLLM